LHCVDELPDLLIRFGYAVKREIAHTWLHDGLFGSNFVWFVTARGYRARSRCRNNRLSAIDGCTDSFAWVKPSYGGFQFHGIPIGRSSMNHQSNSFLA
jgi:hypothetical protein